MNMHNKNKFYLFFILVIFAFLVPVISVANVSPANDFDVSKFLGFDVSELSSRTPKTSSYYNLTGSKILIDDADPNYNWTKKSNARARTKALADGRVKAQGMLSRCIICVGCDSPQYNARGLLLFECTDFRSKR